MEDQYYVGSDLKFRIDVSVEEDSFNVYDDDFSVSVMGGSKVVTWEKTSTECDPHIKVITDVEPEESPYILLLIPTEMFGNGPLKVAFTAKVSDSDFDDINPGGYRREVGVDSLGTLKRVR